MTSLAASQLLAVVDPGEGVAPPGAEGIATIVQWVAWTVLAVCVVGVLLVGARMALAHRRGEGAEHALSLAYVLGGAVLVGSASGLIAALV
ncbi:hypothetical protein [Geodermatophilus ruber]|uniref:TrbC/VIRB2 family protein n=1 Tax=Geodermatophilus ruber TaxID=504800 RepID=A0A1I4GA84_9ACTN|nr:hypothetical protein [Geodermatophilus ruber]SFL26972.1 hypothetical protein SAMN04488085_108230 [Geodermatophilus ruber]